MSGADTLLIENMRFYCLCRVFDREIKHDKKMKPQRDINKAVIEMRIQKLGELEDQLLGHYEDLEYSKQHGFTHNADRENNKISATLKQIGRLEWLTGTKRKTR